jgi:hypothetical protein
MLADKVIHHLQVVPVKDIIMTSQRHEFVSLNGQYPSPIFFNGQTGFRGIKFDSFIGQRLYPLRRTIGAAIVQHVKIKIVICLGKYAIHTFLYIFASITDRKDD